MALKLEDASSRGFVSRRSWQLAKLREFDLVFHQALMDLIPFKQDALELLFDVLRLLGVVLPHLL